MQLRHITAPSRSVVEIKMPFELPVAYNLITFTQHFLKLHAFCQEWVAISSQTGVEGNTYILQKHLSGL